MDKRRRQIGMIANNFAGVNYAGLTLRTKNIAHEK